MKTFAWKIGLFLALACPPSVMAGSPELKSSKQTDSNSAFSQQLGFADAEAKKFSEQEKLRWELQKPFMTLWFAMEYQEWMKNDPEMRPIFDKIRDKSDLQTVKIILSDASEKFPEFNEVWKALASKIIRMNTAHELRYSATPAIAVIRFRLRTAILADDCEKFIREAYLDNMDEVKAGLFETIESAPLY